MSTTPTLLALIDAYAEARHTNGDSTYNATTKAARDAVVAALANSPGFEGIRTGAALTQGAGAVEPVAWPRDAAEVRQFMNSNCESVEFAVDEATPDDGDRYQLTAHDFLSAVNWWADFPHHPSEEVAQQLQQAVARAVERCAAICEDLADRACAAQEGPTDDTTNVMLRQVATLGARECAALIRAKGTHQ